MKKILVGLIGGILAVVGSFLPWGVATVFGTVETFPGIKGAGIFTLILAILGIIFLFLAVRFRKASIGTIITGLIIPLLCFQQMLMVKEAEVEAERMVPGITEVSIGYGLYLTLVGGIILLIGGIIAMRAAKRT